MFVASAATPLMGIGLVEASREFDAAAFRHTFDRDADVRQVWDAAAIHPQLLGSVKNSLNGLTFGFGVPRERIATAVIARNSSTLLLFDSAAWKQYHLGELFAVRDPRGAAVIENVFWPSRSANRSADPSDPRGFYQRLGSDPATARRCLLRLQHGARRTIADHRQCRRGERRVGRARRRNAASARRPRCDARSVGCCCGCVLAVALPL
jgi:hypothetical protein